MGSGPEALVPPIECSDAGSSDESAAGEDNRAKVKEVIENFRLRRHKGNFEKYGNVKPRYLTGRKIPVKKLKEEKTKRTHKVIKPKSV